MCSSILIKRMMALKKRMQVQEEEEEVGDKKKEGAECGPRREYRKDKIKLTMMQVNWSLELYEDRKDES